MVWSHRELHQAEKAKAFPREDELLSRKQAREELALTANGRYALFSLGAGNINDVEAIGAGLIQQLQAAGLEVIWVNNPISIHKVDLPEGVQSISVYPLVRSLHAFDVFIGAAGYNTCCEVIQAQVPALLVPNTQTKLDDQYRRANLIANMSLLFLGAKVKMSGRQRSRSYCEWLIILEIISVLLQ